VAEIRNPVGGIILAGCGDGEGREIWERVAEYVASMQQGERR
jgi:hypothetical protein